MARSRRRRRRVRRARRGYRIHRGGIMWYVEVDELSDSQRGNKGYGSSGN